MKADTVEELVAVLAKQSGHDAIDDGLKPGMRCETLALNGEPIPRLYHADEVDMALGREIADPGGK